MELDKGVHNGKIRENISKFYHHVDFECCRTVTNHYRVELANHSMELHRISRLLHTCEGVLICHRKGVFKIICLISFLIGYITTPYDPMETNKDAKLFQLIALAASIATVITLALM